MTAKGKRRDGEGADAYTANAAEAAARAVKLIS